MHGRRVFLCFPKAIFNALLFCAFLAFLLSVATDVILVNQSEQKYFEWPIGKNFYFLIIMEQVYIIPWKRPSRLLFMFLNLKSESNVWSSCSLFVAMKTAMTAALHLMINHMIINHKTATKISTITYKQTSYYGRKMHFCFCKQHLISFLIACCWPHLNLDKLYSD